MLHADFKDQLDIQSISSITANNVCVYYYHIVTITMATSFHKYQTRPLL